MSKLIWSRTSYQIADPARVQRSTDNFVSSKTKDQNKNKRKKVVKELTPAQIQRRLAHKARLEVAKVEKKQKYAAELIMKAQQHLANSEAKAERRAKATLDQKVALARKKLKTEKRRAEADVRRATFAEYQKTQQYAEKLAKERDSMAAKTKSHLQTWIDEQTNLSADRDGLKQQWRKRLLPKPK